MQTIPGDWLMHKVITWLVWIKKVAMQKNHRQLDDLFDEKDENEVVAEKSPSIRWFV